MKGKDLFSIAIHLAALVLLSIILSILTKRDIKLLYLEEKGIAAKALVTAQWHGSKLWTGYQLEYEFYDNKGDLVKSSSRVTAGLWENVTIGDSLQVLFWPDDSSFVLIDSGFSDRKILLFYIRTSFISLIILIIIYRLIRLLVKTK